MVFPYFSALNNPNENVRVWAARAIAHHGSVAIDPVIEEWGLTGDRSSVDGRRYSSKAPGTLLLGVPVHFVHDRLARLFTGYSPEPRATTLVLRLFAAVPIMALGLLLFARRVERQTGSPFARDLLTMGLGLGTMLYPYGLTFVGHGPSAVLLFAGFVALHPLAETRASSPSDRQGRGRLALAGVLTALSVVFEYQSLLGAVVLAAYALYRERRQSVYFALGALGPAVALGLYHAALFGRPWTLPYAHLDDPGYQMFHHAQGFLGLGPPKLRVLRASLFNVNYGLFVFSPFLAAGAIVALVAFVRRRPPHDPRDRAAHAVTLAIAAALLTLLAGMANWRAGWCAGGPRYVAAAVPFLAFAPALAWREVFEPRPWLRAGLTALVLSSVALCLLSGAVFPHFPLQFDNPIFDLVIPLLSDGYAPHSLGTLLGLSGLASLLPLMVVVVVAVAATLAAGRIGRGWRSVMSVAAASVALSALLLVALSGYGRRPRSDEEHGRAFVRKVWEPAPAQLAPGGPRGPA